MQRQPGPGIFSRLIFSPLRGRFRTGKARPYFPLAFLALDRASGLILCNTLAPRSTAAHDFQNTFLCFLEEKKIIPAEIRASGEEMLAFLKPAAAGLGIKLTAADTLPHMEEARASFFAFLKKQGPHT
jgi:hypothetical protein